MKFIAVAGNIGAGKSSLVEFLERRHGMRPIYEPYLGNPYLDDFYGDMRGYAFRSQLYFLTHKFRLHLGLGTENGTIVLDRTIYEDAEIFARNLHQQGHIDARDFGLYNELYASMKQALRPPDLLIYLRCSTTTIRRRIKQRGRPSEQNIPLDYIKRLNALYEDWIARYDQCPVLVWESDKKDYLTDLVDWIEFKRRIDLVIGGAGPGGRNDPSPAVTPINPTAGGSA
ncbi:MAG TPA: deoxynucleoside kinase [Myxococcota bacterium]|nr:deoxynucleoside kinase [Myxococcota bacterium]